MRTDTDVERRASRRAGGPPTTEDERAAGAWPDPNPEARPRRRLTSRLSAGHLLMLVAAVTAALTNLALLQGGDDGSEFLVAATDLEPGQRLGGDALVARSGEVDDEVLDALVAPDAIGQLEGQVLTTSVGAGSPLRRADLRPASGSDGMRRISVGVPRERAVGGAVGPGDRVDVIEVVEGRPRFILADAPVLAVSDRATSGLGGAEAFAVTLAVDADSALCLAGAIQRGEITVVASTGQTPVDASGCAPAGPEGSTAGLGDADGTESGGDRDEPDADSPTGSDG